MSEGIPANDTPTPQDVWEHELTFHSENVTAIGRASGDYYLVFLPYKIEKFGWEAGEDYLLLEKVEGDPAYIRGEKATPDYTSHTRISSKKAVYAIRTQGSNRPRVGIPKMWADEFLDYGGDEALTVELNEVEDEPHIRIYDGESAQRRKAQLIEEGHSVKDGPSRVVGPAGIAYSVKKLVEKILPDRSSPLEVSVSDTLVEESKLRVSVEADLPDLERLLVQHRRKEEPGFTDIDEAASEPLNHPDSEIPDDSESLPRPFTMETSYDLSEENDSRYRDGEPVIHEFRARARYGDDEYVNSEVSQIRIK